MQSSDIYGPVSEDKKYLQKLLLILNEIYQYAQTKINLLFLDECDDKIDKKCL